MAGIMHSFHRKKSSESPRLIVAVLCGIFMGFLIGSSIPSISISKVDLSPHHGHVEGMSSMLSTYFPLNSQNASLFTSGTANSLPASERNRTKICITKNPRGAELLAPGIVVSESDLELRRLYGDPSEDIVKSKYLLVLTVGMRQMDIVNDIVSKFSENFSVLMFHYDGTASEWDQFEWSQRAIHVSGRKQAKWWYAKRFLHPDIVAPFEYIFIWDEDLGVENFNAEEYLKLVRKHNLEISQPGLAENDALTWFMTRRRVDVEVHMETEERPGWCHDRHLPPCAGFVEIMAPVFSRRSWRCVWHMIQNDLIHGWGLDLALQKCVELQPAHEKIGVVDAQWIVHKVLPSLGDQGDAKDGRQPWEGVRARCNDEWAEFRIRMDKAEKEYFNKSV
ncbi:uncharacterized protein LOC18448245 isoform X1 [Amborella trichopoda]|uniref:uncharacterized protein LOC18448245 isoform X1 n=2 Tax=Amborella trichopoda TaxID=13333 RepID=UPI0005D41602|nr:uncharacterized protein LOC18448245 isoform X1 [Amborella trichopoda]XP_011628538.1 uncharacterized protein LOC18448245 isoform X1 [Amborella trichopoda]|eukprot:XP_011628537.1 uncharacterized protein LOC18448245 isoform X1 [Amborella trichopoda]